MPTPRTAFLSLLLVTAGCAMAGPDAPAIGFDGKADGDPPTTPDLALAPAYRLDLTSHVVTEDADGEITVYDSRLDGYLEPATTEEGTSLIVVPCHVELPEADGRKPKVSDATVRGRPPVHLPAIFDRDEEGNTLLATETGALELGVALDDPLSDALPTDGGDPRVLDDDDDGEVGVTIDLDGWKIYLAARARLWLSGRIDAESGVISGDADLTMDVEIYGDNIPFVDVRARVAAGQASETRVIEVTNGFTLTPLDAAPTGCGALD